LGLQSTDEVSLNQTILSVLPAVWRDRVMDNQDNLHVETGDRPYTIYNVL